MPDAVDFEAEVTKLRSLIDEKRRDQVTKRAAADELRDSALKEGLDVTKLGSDSNTRSAFDKIDEAYKEADGLADEIVQAEGALQRIYGWTGRTGPGAGPGRTDAGGTGPSRRASAGRRVVESEAFQALRASGAPGNAKAEIRMGPATAWTREEFKDLLRTRAGLDLASGQAMVTPEFQLIPPVELPVRQVRLLDLMNVQTTETDAVVWGQQTARVLAAAPTASGVNAPQATMAFVRQTAMVRRIPVLLTVPKEVLADEGRMQGILDQQLLTDARLSVEAQALAGDGTGENFTGVLEAGGIGSYAQGTVAGEYALDAIHKGITYVRLHLFQDPDGIGLHPTDLETIVLQKDGFARYIFPPTEDQASIWGFPAIPTPVFPLHTAVVGNWRMGATVWLREDVVVTATDGYTDTATGVNYFAAGLVAVMAQIRAAFAVERPFAFCEVTALANVAH